MTDRGNGKDGLAQIPSRSAKRQREPPLHTATLDDDCFPLEWPDRRVANPRGEGGR